MGYRWTSTGRVVYDRKTHFFRWTDAKRIIDKIEAPRFFDVVVNKRDRRDFVALLAIWARVTKEIADYFNVWDDIIPMFQLEDSWRPFAEGVQWGTLLWERIRSWLQR